MLSAIAYAGGFVELSRQLAQLGIGEADIVVGSGGPTYAGLLLGALASGRQSRVHSVPPRGHRSGAHAHVRDLVREASAPLGLGIVDPVYTGNAMAKSFSLAEPPPEGARAGLRPYGGCANAVRV